MNLKKLNEELNKILEDNSTLDRLQTIINCDVQIDDNNDMHITNKQYNIDKVIDSYDIDDCLEELNIRDIRRLPSRKIKSFGELVVQEFNYDYIYGDFDINYNGVTYSSSQHNGKDDEIIEKYHLSKDTSFGINLDGRSLKLNTETLSGSINLEVNLYAIQENE